MADLLYSHHVANDIGDVKRRMTHRRRRTSPPEAGSRLKWVTATDPAQFKKRETLREVRTHVMVDYLTKKETNDTPALEKPSVSLSPPMCLPDHTASRDCSLSDITSGDRALELYYNGQRNVKASSTTSKRKPSAHGILDYDESATELGRYARALRKMQAMAPVNQPLVLPRRDVLTPLPYDMAFKYLTPLSYDIGKPLDPFSALPQSTSSGVNVEELKFHCSHLFGTRAMGVRWVPALLKGRHAFLSTLCVASTHLDIMASQAHESQKTTRLRIEVVNLVGQSLANPRTRVDDSTIMAVLQLTCSELVRGDSKDILWHENGLEQMIRMRGGLDHLGVKPDLAVMTIIISFLSAISKEMLPRRLYRDFASNYLRNSLPKHRLIPESPLYCPQEEFFTIIRSKKCSSVTFGVICDIHEMIRLFAGAGGFNHKKQGVSRHDSVTLNEQHHTCTKRSTNRIHSLYKKIMGLPSAHEKDEEVFGDWIYESCRIAACINATAIAKGVSFSVAASTATSVPTGLLTPAQELEYSTVHLGKPNLLYALRSALDQSDLSDCWMDHNMTGVLLWILLIGSAAAATITIPTPAPQSPGPPEPSQTGFQPPSIFVYADSAEPSQEERLLRKWIIAMAVRCSILLAFEHKGAVVESMGQFLHMGERLGNQSEARCEGVVTTSEPAAIADASISLPELPSTKRRRKI